MRLSLCSCSKFMCATAHKFCNTFNYKAHKPHHQSPAVLLVNFPQTPSGSSYISSQKNLYCQGSCPLKCLTWPTHQKKKQKTFAFSKKKKRKKEENILQKGCLRNTCRQQSVFSDRRTARTALRSIKLHTSPSGFLIGINAPHGDGRPRLSS